MDIPRQLRDLARNLYWTWHPELISIFRDIDPNLWREVNHNPVEFLDRIPAGDLQQKAGDLSLEARISQAFHQMQAYLESLDTWGAFHAGPLNARPVAYFSAEFGLHESLPLYSGGLGVLAGDHLKSASDLGVPVVGVGLFYANGYFRQLLDQAGWQHEEYPFSDLRRLPLERALDAQGKPLTVGVRTRNSEICIGIWTARVGRSRLVLLDTNFDCNSDQDRRLTSQLYGGDKPVRIRQELVLGVGGMRALEVLGIEPGAIHLNEGHSAFAVLELARRTMQQEKRPFSDIRQRMAARTVFTTHTPVQAGHDRFDKGLVEETFGVLREEMGLSRKDLMALGRIEPANDDEPFCMTVLGLRMSEYRNAVSARHAQVSRAMWRRIWPELAEDLVPIGHITNGIHLTTWLAAPIAPLFDRYLGRDWTGRTDDAHTWQAVAEIDDAEFWEQHQILNAHLVDYVARVVKRQTERRGDSLQTPRLNPMALTVGFARRFADYKRSTLLFHDLDRLARMVSNPERPVQFIFAGKAHPSDEAGKRSIQMIVELTRREPFLGRVVFLEDHDMNVGRHLVQGVDVWLNTPRAPNEACGTSGQKAILNGGLNLSVLDGWWAQAFDGSNGFAVGSRQECSSEKEQDRRDASALYDALEKQVVPLFYARDSNGIPHGWVARQKHAIRTLAWKFNAQRMVKDYTTCCYLPAAGGTTSHTD